MTTLQIILILIGLAAIIWAPCLAASLYTHYTTRKKLRALEKFFKTPNSK